MAAAISRVSSQHLSSVGLTQRLIYAFVYNKAVDFSFNQIFRRECFLAGVRMGKNHSSRQLRAVPFQRAGQ